MLPLPFPQTDVLKLADWMEISSIQARARGCSLGDMSRQLKKSSALEEDRLGADSVEADVYNELMSRAKAAGGRYPFTIDGARTTLRSRIEDYPSYMFCLCLSYFGADRVRGLDFFPTRAFETISCTAARSYIQGEGLRFGAPRDTLPSRFDSAVNELCVLVGEGGGFRKRGRRLRQDDTLDLVAWKDFADRQPGKILMFGQCATGHNWKRKLSELNPADFCRLWLTEAPVSVFKAFFLPHRVHPSEWTESSVRAGIIFDRCRLSSWATPDAELRRLCVRWCRQRIKSST